jgi:hypothetical protein
MKRTDRRTFLKLMGSPALAAVLPPGITGAWPFWPTTEP